jgi:beta-lactamase superfamily II metal-dependent hydrolase
MNDKFTLPKKGFVFWPVGTGDSTTIVVKENKIIFQLDLHHLEKSEDSDDSAWPIVDELVRLLPKKDGKPYLSVFALTHPDQDHVLGFKELIRRVTIGEIWHTPRIFRDYEDENDLCEDAEGRFNRCSQHLPE